MSQIEDDKNDREAIIEIRNSSNGRIGNIYIQGDGDAVKITQSQNIQLGSLTKFGEGRIISADEVQGLVVGDLSLYEKLPSGVAEALAADVKRRDRESFTARLAPFIQPEKIDAVLNLWNRLIG